MLVCHRVDPGTLEKLIAKASHQSEVGKIPDQVRYLGSYLAKQTPRAKTIVEEQDYTDRHYLEEYVGYYANRLMPPSSKATRLHFFAEAIDDEKLHAWIEEAADGSIVAWSEIREKLEESYLGYSVIRPFPAAPIGRTVLRPYPWGPSVRELRCFAPATSRHTVHLAGLRFEVEGLPFQQQEQAVGACATTALWSSLARVVRADGGRPPTPYAVTLAATRHFLQGRDFPAVAGLDRNQMYAALREFGYSPYAFKPGEPGLFEMAVKCYLRSGIPVVLQVMDEGTEGHAVTVAGFREGDELEPAGEIEITLESGGSLRTNGMSRLYLHDDRLGPYARASWKYKDKYPMLEYLLSEPGFEAFEESPMDVSEAIVPHYPKMRLTAVDLIRFAGQLLQPVRSIAGPDYRDSLRVDLWFSLAGDYLEDVYRSSLEPSNIRRFLLACRLSRYVGVIRFSVGEEPFVDILYDTTDIRRDADPWAGILAFLPSAEVYSSAFRDFAARYKIPAIVAGAD